MASQTVLEEKAAAEIMYLFRHFYRDQWAPGHIFDGKSRIWIKVFNKLVRQGLIKKKKKDIGYEYMWVSEFPENY